MAAHAFQPPPCLASNHGEAGNIVDKGVNHMPAAAQNKDKA